MQAYWSFLLSGGDLVECKTIATTTQQVGQASTCYFELSLKTKVTVVVREHIQSFNIEYNIIK